MRPVRCLFTNSIIKLDFYSVPQAQFGGAWPPKPFHFYHGIIIFHIL